MVTLDTKPCDANAPQTTDMASCEPLASELAYEDTEHYQITRDFLAAPQRFFHHLFSSKQLRSE